MKLNCNLYTTFYLALAISLHLLLQIPSTKCHIFRAISNYKNVQGILDIADSFTSLPNEDMQNILCDSLKRSGNGVAETFFNQSSIDATFGDKDFTALRNELAVSVVAIDLNSVSS